MKPVRPRIGFVIHRYGLEITGGSEMLCRQLAERLSKVYDIEIITTCAVDHLSWKNVLPKGESRVNGVPVRRFPSIEERNLLKFHEIYDRIFTEQLSTEAEKRMIRFQGPYCPSLVEYLESSSHSYDAFVFFTYMYYPVVHGLPVVRDKAVLVPTVHDEASLYVHLLDELFAQTRWFIFNTQEEQYLAQRRFNLPSSAGRVAGMGLDTPQPGKADSQWEILASRLQGQQVLTYVGRVENGKGCDELVEFFLRYIKEENRSDLILLMLGKRTLVIPNHPQLISPGFVSEYVKYHALDSTDVSVAPSALESLCIAALESWQHGCPLLANGFSPVLVGHCLRSNGGLWYTNYLEFHEALKRLLGDSTTRGALGRQGREYVANNYRWAAVERIYCEVIDEIVGCEQSDAGDPVGSGVTPVAR